MLLSQFITPLASCCCGCSLTTLCPTLCDPMDCSTAGFPSLLFTNSLSLLKLMSFESVMPSNHFILCHPLLCHSLLLLPSIWLLILHLFAILSIWDKCSLVPHKNIILWNQDLECTH